MLPLRMSKTNSHVAFKSTAKQFVSAYVTAQNTPKQRNKKQNRVKYMYILSIFTKSSIQFDLVTNWRNISVVGKGKRAHLRGAVEAARTDP